MSFQRAFRAICILLIFGCSTNIELDPFAPEVKGNAGYFCTRAPDIIQHYVKFLFIIDKSGSNNETDPGAYRRASNIEAFYNQHQRNQFMEWGLIVFNGGKARALIGKGENSPEFSSDVGEIRSGINEIRNKNDSGQTPYGSALSLAEDAIRDDMSKDSEQRSTYMVFFVSDGLPTDINSVVGLEERVRSLKQVASGKIYLSSAYYGRRNFEAETRLRRMAEVGEGEYINLAGRQNLDYNDLIAGGQNRERWFLKNFVVYNLNASFCENGKIDVDSDGDGLCDQDEIRHGLNPRRRFSREGGFSDWFVRREQLGEKLPRCMSRRDQDLDLLTDCEEAFIENRSGVSRNPNEKNHIHGDPLNPDTDLDGFIDGIELYVFKNKGAPMNGINVTYSHDGEREEAGLQIKQHRNPLVSDPHQPAYDVRIEHAFENRQTGQNCYTYKQDVLPLYPTLATDQQGNFPSHVHRENENLIYVHFIQTPESDPLGRGVLSYSLQKLRKGSSRGLQINDHVLKHYVVPK